MNENELYIGYAGWFLIIILISFLFDFFVRQKVTGFKLILLTVLPAWLLYSVAMIFSGILYINTDHFFDTFTTSLIEALPHVILIGGFTLVYKFYRLKRSRQIK